MILLRHILAKVDDMTHFSYTSIYDKKSELIIINKQFIYQMEHFITEFIWRVYSCISTDGNIIQFLEL